MNLKTRQTIFITTHYIEDAERICDRIAFIVKRVALSPILQLLDNKGILVYEAKEIKPSLEDVFVKITGIEASKLKKRKGGGECKMKALIAFGIF